MAISIAVALCAAPVVSAEADCVTGNEERIFQSLQSSPVEAERICQNHRAVKTVVGPTHLNELFH